jgi:hypothetical protein
MKLASIQEKSRWLMSWPISLNSIMMCYLVHEKESLLLVAAGVQDIQVPAFHEREEVLDRSHAKLIGPQVHHLDFELPEALLNEVALVVRGIVQHENGGSPPVPLEAVEVLD